MDFVTKSERLFCELCSSHGFIAEKIPERSKEKKKTADFRVIANSHTFIAEVKEILPNTDDIEYARDLSKDNVRARSYTIGNRMRREIRDAKPQLKAHRNELIPIILVVFSNMKIGDINLGPHVYVSAPEIDAAMFGFLTVSSARIAQENRPLDRSGGGRTITEKEKKYLSAICVISDYDEETLYIYHNPFADYPLPIEIFSEFKGEQYRKPQPIFNNPQKWEKC